MKRSQVFPSRYLGKDDVETPAAAVISDIRMETIKGDHGDEDRPVMFFVGELKPMIVNNTNWMACEDVYGDDSDTWRGKQVEIYVDPGVMFGGKRVGGVRIRIPSRAGQVTIPTSQSPAPVMEFSDAVKTLEGAGLSPDDLKNKIKALGGKGWNAQRDVPILNEMVALAKANTALDDEIPF